MPETPSTPSVVATVAPVSTTTTTTTTAAPVVAPASAAKAASTTTPSTEGGMKSHLMHIGIPVALGAGLGYAGFFAANHFKQNKWIGIVGGVIVGLVGGHFIAKHLEKK